MAYADNLPGLHSMFVQHEIDISNRFSAGDTLLFRLQMISGASSAGWGWAIDYVSIQELPLGFAEQRNEHPVTVFPNPSTGSINIAYDLSIASEIAVELIDLFGRSKTKINFGRREAGAHIEILDLDTYAAGTYILKLATDGEPTIAKFMIKH
jgi:hypothetical protein